MSMASSTSFARSCRSSAGGPDCSLAIVGRTPPPAIAELAQRDPSIHITGTVPDIRPYLWNSAVSIVPLRVGGGTRLKIYEAMAAGVPVVSTSVGAEGLAVTAGSDILLADDPAAFAASCLALLDSADRRARQAARAREVVCSNFSWTKVAESFEDILRA